MKYKSNSRFKMLIQLKDGIKEIFPNEIFSCSEVLNYQFLTKLDSEAAFNLADSIAPPSKRYAKSVAPKKRKRVAKVVPDKTTLETPLKEDLNGSDNSEG